MFEDKWWGRDVADHSLYCSFHCAFQPSGTTGAFGGGGPGGGAKSMMVD